MTTDRMTCVDCGTHAPCPHCQPQPIINDVTFEGDAESMTLAEAKEWLEERLPRGARCPCCTQNAKIYRRHINSAMACVLILMERYYRSSTDWLHVPSHIAGLGLAPRLAASVRGDWHKMRYWGLIVSKNNIRDDGSTRTGYWRITPAGVDFVHRRCVVTQYAHVFDERVIRWSGRTDWTITDALDERFNYDELMRLTG